MDATTELPDRRLDIGGNGPPSAIDSAQDLIAAATQWLNDREAIEDTDAAKEAADHVERLRGAKKALAAAIKIDLAPHEAVIQSVKSRYDVPAAAIENRLTLLLQRSAAWLQKERTRIAAEKAAQEAEARRLREEADRIRREAEEAARNSAADARDAEEAARVAAEASAANRTAREAERAAYKKPEAAAIKGDTAKRAMTLRVYWSAVVTDEAAAIEAYKDHPTVRKATLDAALRVANEAARVAKSETAAPAGFRFVKDERAS